MRHHLVSRCCSTLVLGTMLLCSALVLAQQPASIGQVTALQGRATIQHQGEPRAIPLNMHSPVYPGDVLQTAVASKFKLTLLDGTELTLGEQGSMTLSRFVYDPQQKSQNVLLRITSGIFRAVTPKFLSQGQFEVHTTTSVAAIRGTDWMGQVMPETTGIVVLRGKVAVANANPAISGEVVLERGLGTDVQVQSPPTAPKKWGAARVQTLQRATTLP